jgi:hypothetical protein
MVDASFILDKAVATMSEKQVEGNRRETGV